MKMTIGSRRKTSGLKTLESKFKIIKDHNNNICPVDITNYFILAGYKVSQLLRIMMLCFLKIIYSVPLLAKSVSC